MKPVRVRVNEVIRAKEIRVVDEDAGQLGIMTPEQALAHCAVARSGSRGSGSGSQSARLPDHELW